MSLPPLALLVIGMLALVLGAELLVRGAARFARAMGVSPLVVGLTLVAFGTSAPEVAVSLDAALSGAAALALGNAVGSNIFNILVVLGISALVAPLSVERQLIRFDVPVMVAVSFLPLVLGLDRVLGRGDGVLLLVLGVAYTGGLAWFALRTNGADEQHAASTAEAAAGSRAVDVVMGLGGLAVLVGGAEAFTVGAVSLARSFGVSELVIGLTVVACATSLPELATSVAAAARGEREMAVGNAIGSNIFNVLFVLGSASVAAPNGLPVPTGALTLDLPIMVAVAVACFPVFLTGLQITRWEGGVFLGTYLLYVVYLVLRASTHDARDEFVTMVTLFVAPLTLALVLGGWWLGWRSDPSPGGEEARP